MSEGSSYRQILRSSSIIGGASVINILVGLLRMKVAAVLLGPGGLGSIGLLQSLMAVASTMSALGFGTVGTRQIAEANGCEDELAVGAARRALFWGTVGLALLGASGVWLLRDTLAAKVLGDVGSGGQVGWLAIGVALTVASGGQGALLNGLRRIGDLARVSILSGMLSTALGIAALLLWQDKGILVFVISAPLASFLAGNWYVSRLPKVISQPTPLSHLIDQWKTLARLGTAFMLAGLAFTVGQLAVRAMVQHQLGVEALGYFQAASMISMTYIGFVLQAMGTDYYPRLAAVISDPSAVNRLANEQTEVALLMAGPVFLAMMGTAPWIVEWLYSSAFSGSVNVLRWQVLGDILKVASWPLGFILLAAGEGHTFMLSETFAISVFVALTWVGLPLVGVEATGLAFLAMYLVCLPTVYVLAWRRTGFAWRRRVSLHVVLLVALGIAVLVAAAWSRWLGAAVGLGVALALGVYALVRFGKLADEGAVAGLAGRIRNAVNRFRSQRG